MKPSSPSSAMLCTLLQMYVIQEVGCVEWRGEESWGEVRSGEERSGVERKRLER
jgi:hypothetical protein